MFAPVRGERTWAVARGKQQELRKKEDSHEPLTAMVQVLPFSNPKLSEKTLVFKMFGDILPQTPHGSNAPV